MDNIYFGVYFIIIVVVLLGLYVNFDWWYCVFMGVFFFYWYLYDKFLKFKWVM